jgi:uncharacterized protein YecT (DUF1311 family)
VVLVVVAVMAASVNAADRLAPPVIREPFAPLPCPSHATTTAAMEGCAEKFVLATDHEINTRVRTIFRLLLPTARGGFVQSERWWLSYRRASCTAQVARYAGGSIQPLDFVYCEVSRNRTHLKDLGELLRELRFH